MNPFNANPIQASFFEGNSNAIYIMGISAIGMFIIGGLFLYGVIKLWEI